MSTLNVPGYGNVTYKEIPGSPREQMSGNTWRVTRTFDVPHTSRWLFLLGMFGNATVINREGGPNNQMISRILPQGYQINIGNSNTSWMYPTSVEAIEPLGVVQKDQNTGVATSDTCRITLGYEAPHFAIKPDTDFFFASNNFSESYLGRYVSIFVQPTAEYLTLPYGSYLWAELDPTTKVYSKGTPVVGSQAQLVSSLEIQIIWHMVPGIPQNAYSQIGTVNNAFFADNQFRFNAPPGCMLLTQMELRPYRWFFGSFLYDITYKFKYFNPIDPSYDVALWGGFSSSQDQAGNYIGHNHFLHYRPNPKNVPQKPYYAYLTHDGTPPSNSKKPGTGVPVYRYTNFDSLFDPPLNGVNP